MLAPHYSILCRLDALPDAQPTNQPIKALKAVNVCTGKQSNHRSHFAGAVCALPSPSPSPWWQWDDLFSCIRLFAANASPALCSHITPRQRPNGPVRCWMTLFAVDALQCIVNGEENPQNYPSSWDFVTLPEEWATAIGNMHRQNW